MSETKVEDTNLDPRTAPVSCDECKATMEKACATLIVIGVVAAPEEATVVAIVKALNDLGLVFGADTVQKWITQATKEGINNVEQLSKYICKQAGVC